MHILTIFHMYFQTRKAQSLPVLSQTEGVQESLLTEPADVVTNHVLYLSKGLLGLFRHLHDVQLRVDVTCKIGGNYINICEVFMKRFVAGENSSGDH